MAVMTKKADTRFTIQFNRAIPSHIRVAEILNRQERFAKAQYIVDAVLFYEENKNTPDKQRMAQIDGMLIEAAVNRIFGSLGTGIAGIANTSDPLAAPGDKDIDAEGIDFDDSIDALGEDGFGVVSGALEMFRSK